MDHRAAVWDIAAGALIVLGKRRRITGLDGAPCFPLDLAGWHDAPVPFVAGNASARAEALAVLAAV